MFLPFQIGILEHAFHTVFIGAHEGSTCPPSPKMQERLLLWALLNILPYKESVIDDKYNILILISWLGVPMDLGSHHSFLWQGDINKWLQ